METGYKLKKHSSSREISRNIPDDVLFEGILVRLSVKSLTIYKSVCKTWLYTIESNSFREIHRCRHIRYSSDQILISPFKIVSDSATKSSSLLPGTHCFVSHPWSGPRLCDPTIKMAPLNVMLPPEITRMEWQICEETPPVLALGSPFKVPVRVLGPVKSTGIYLVYTHLLETIWLPNANISICNPATRDYKLANPFPPEEMARILDLTVGHCSLVSYGFGLASDGDYKVVLVMTWGPSFTVFLSYVYSFKQGVWKKIVDSETAMVSGLHFGGKPYYPEITDFCREVCPQVFVNGCWHWMAKLKDDTDTVLSFDVDNEVFKLVSTPPSDETSYGILSTLNDHLAFLSESHAAISVWMMMEYGDEESWIKVWTLNAFDNSMEALVGISYSLKEDGNGGIHIHRILYQDEDQELVSCDEFGVIKRQPGFDTSSCIFWNNIGISAYSETLERIQYSSGAAER